MAACTTTNHDRDVSVARIWNEVLLEGIRNDYARPTVHARNLWHSSAAMYDAWAAFDPQAGQLFHQEKLAANDVEAARRDAAWKGHVSVRAGRVVDVALQPSYSMFP